MGIKNLLPLLRNVCPGVFHDTHISCFAFQKVGVDISLYLYKYKAFSRDGYISSVVSLLLSLRGFQVHPVVVFDGEAPREKEEERKKRSNSRDNLEDKANALEASLETYKNMGEMDDLLRGTMERIDKKKGESLLRLKASIKIDISAVEEYIERLRSQAVKITGEDLEYVREICDILKIPCVQAPGEAEAFCSFMCLKGEFAAVLSEDSDILTYRAPVFASKYNIGTGECRVIFYKEVLEGLQLSERQFLDLCIMCGTDYNENIPRIGSKTALQLLWDSDGIESIEYIRDKTDVLNYERGREIFTTFDNKLSILSKITTPWSGCINEIKRDKFNEFICIHNCSGLSSLFEQSFRCEHVDYS